MKKARRPIQLLASPWSPPAWMKVPLVENNKTVSKMTGSHTPNGLRSDRRVMTAWARYISLFISAYEEHGVPIWAVTPQNEPEFAAPWEACAYNASFESFFVEKFLGPVLRSEHPEVPPSSLLPPSCVLPLPHSSPDQDPRL
jgi:glucosylceramidase